MKKIEITLKHEDQTFARGIIVEDSDSPETIAYKIYTLLHAVEKTIYYEVLSK